MELDYVALGERIRQRRQEKGLTQSYVAEQAGIEPSNISHRTCSIKSRVKYTGKDCQYFGVHSK